MIMIALRCCALLAVLTSTHAAVQSDEVKSLPGWTKALPSRMYSGYVTIPQSNRKVHYWFVESESNTSKTDPVVLWVQGGPGGTSLMGMWTENMGPLTLNTESMKTEPPTLFRASSPWTQNANMLFWEAPAGVGFSYCDGSSCPRWNDTTTAADNAQFLCEWFKLYSEYQSNDFYIWGESYAGVYIPITVLRLMETGMCKNTLNLKGVAIGNGCTGTDVGPCSPGRAKYTIDQLYMHGMYSEETRSLMQMNCADSIAYTQPNAECRQALIHASEEAGTFNLYNVHDTCGPPDETLADHLAGWGVKLSDNYTVPSQLYEGSDKKMFSTTPMRAIAGRKLLEEKQPENYKCGGKEALSAYLSRSDVQSAINVNQQPAWPGPRIGYDRTYKDLLAKGYPKMIDNMRVLIYSGDFDADIPIRATEEWTRGLGYQVRNPMRPWLLHDGQLAGRVVEYDVRTEFTFATVAGAGHEAPTYKPHESYQLFMRFLNGGQY